MRKRLVRRRQFTRLSPAIDKFLRAISETQAALSDFESFIREASTTPMSDSSFMAVINDLAAIGLSEWFDALPIDELREELVFE